MAPGGPPMSATQSASHSQSNRALVLNKLENRHVNVIPIV